MNAFTQIQVPSSFWGERDNLAHVYRYAVAREANPYAVLGVCMAYALAATGPELKLPPIIGSPASLNFGLALVAHSGGGKGAALGAGREVFEFRDKGGFLISTPELDSGSGEGVASQFLDTDDEDTPRVTRAVLHESEVSNLGALGGRSGSTLIGTLLKMLMGERVGFTNVQSTREPLEAHSYRLAMTVQVQPDSASALMQHKGAGLPQRFLFVPCTAPDEGLDEVLDLDPMPVKVPSAHEKRIVEVPREVVTEVKLAHRERARIAISDPPPDIDGHLYLLRLKVAAALAVLDGRAGEIDLEDWRLAGALTELHSDVLDELASLANKQSAKSGARRLAEKQDAESELQKINRERAAMELRILDALEAAGTLSGVAFRNGLKGRGSQRQTYDRVIEQLHDRGVVVWDKRSTGKPITKGPYFHSVAEEY